MLVFRKSGDKIGAPNQGVVGEELKLAKGAAELGPGKGDPGAFESWGSVAPSLKSPECNADRGLWISAGDPSSSVALV